MMMKKIGSFHSLILTIFQLYIISLQSIVIKAYGNTVFNNEEIPQFPGQNIQSIGDVNGDGINDIMFLQGLQNKQLAILFSGIQWQNKAFTKESFSNIDGDDGIIIETGIGIRQYLSSAGDFNKDGYADILFRGKYKDREKVILLFGKKDLQNLNIENWKESDGILFDIPLQSSELVGFHVNLAGDINGDKHSDILIGIGSLEQFASFTRPHRCFLIFGKHQSLLPSSLTLDPNTINPYGIYMEIVETKPYFYGNVFVSLGDLNRDGYDDLGIGDPAHNLVWLLFGKKSLLSNIQFNADSSSRLINVVKIVGNVTSEDEFGYNLASAGDYNGDGYLDLFIRTKDKTYLLYGVKDWKMDQDQESIDSGRSMVSILSPFDIPRIHYSSIYPCSDLNGDGLPDTFFFSPNNGGFFLLYGKRKYEKERNIFNLGEDGIHFQFAYHAGMNSISCQIDFDDDSFIDIFFSDPITVGARTLTYFISGKELRNHEKNYFHEVNAQDGADLHGIFALIGIGDFNGDGIDDSIGIPTIRIEIPSNSGYVIPFLCFIQGQSRNLIHGEVSIYDTNTILFHEFPGTIIKDIIEIIYVPIHDVNGDGLSDFIISNSNLRFTIATTFIVFGTRLSLPPTINMSNVVDTNLQLTRIFGYEHEHGHHVQFTSSDLNGDGLFDIVLVHQLISEMKCLIAIFYGRHSFPNELHVRDLPNLIDLTGSLLHQFIPSINGFQFVFGSQFLAVGSSGDINGDGYQDILFKTTGRFSYFFLGSTADNPLSLLCTSNGNETEFIDLPVLYKAEINDQVHSMAVSDLDLDGFDDTIFLIDSQSKTNPMKQILIKFGLPILSGKLDNCESPSLFRNSTRRWDAPSKHITSLVMTDVDGDGRKDLILFETSQITILFTTAEFHQQVRSFEKFPRIHLIVSNPVATTAFFALGDIDHDSFPDFRMEVRILPGSLLAGYYPSRLPTISPTKRFDENEFRVKSFMEKYVRALIQELIFIVFVLLMGIILFLAVTGCKAQDNHKLKKSIEKKGLLRNRGIEMTHLLTLEDPRQDIEQEEDDIMN